MNPLNHFIKIDIHSKNNYRGDPEGDYLQGLITEQEHMKKYGEGTCKKCGRGTGHPKGYTEHCYRHRED